MQTFSKDMLGIPWPPPPTFLCLINIFTERESLLRILGMTDKEQVFSVVFLNFKIPMISSIHEADEHGREGLRVFHTVTPTKRRLSRCPQKPPILPWRVTVVTWLEEVDLCAGALSYRYDYTSSFFFFCLELSRSCFFKATFIEWMSEKTDDSFLMFLWAGTKELSQASPFVMQSCPWTKIHTEEENVNRGFCLFFFFATSAEKTFEYVKRIMSVTMWELNTVSHLLLSPCFHSKSSLFFLKWVSVAVWGNRSLPIGKL